MGMFDKREPVMFLHDLKIRYKLTFSFGIMLFLMVLIGGVAFNRSSKFSRSADISKFIIEKESDHIIWASTIKDLFLQNSKNLEVQTDPTQCGLGKWYYSFIKSSDFLNLPRHVQNKILELEEPHQQLHTSAKEIDTHWAQQHIGLKEKIYARLDDHNQWLADLLNAILNNKPVTVQHDPAKCNLGKWMKSDECRQYMKDSPSFATLIAKLHEPHEALHQSTEKIESTSNKQEKLAIYQTISLSKMFEIKSILYEIIEQETVLEEKAIVSQEVYKKNTLPALEKCKETLKEAAGLLDEEKNTANQSMRVWVVSILIFSIVLAVIIISILVSVITKPLNRGVKTMEEMAKGNLLVTFDAHALTVADETGILTRAMKDMTEQLKDTIAFSLEASENVATGSIELSYSSQVISQCS
jgi:methyl-accepting chemotaxis protein